MTAQELGDVVRNVRRARALRQDQLAAFAQVGVRFVVGLEGGKPTAQLGKALAVLDALGCRLIIETPAGSSRTRPLELTGRDHSTLPM